MKVLLFFITMFVTSFTSVQAQDFTNSSYEELSNMFDSQDIISVSNYLSDNLGSDSVDILAFVKKYNVNDIHSTSSGLTFQSNNSVFYLSTISGENTEYVILGEQPLEFEFNGRVAYFNKQTQTLEKIVSYSDGKRDGIQLNYALGEAKIMVVWKNDTFVSNKPL